MMRWAVVQEGERFGRGGQGGVRVVRDAEERTRHGRGPRRHRTDGGQGAQLVRGARRVPSTGHPDEVPGEAFEETGVAARVGWRLGDGGFEAEAGQPFCRSGVMCSLQSLVKSCEWVVGGRNLPGKRSCGIAVLVRSIRTRGVFCPLGGGMLQGAAP